MMEKLLALPAAAIVALGALLVIQAVLDVVALVDLYKRPKDRLTIANKWVWVAIILLISTIGAIVYLVIGRKPAPAAEVRPASSTATRAADAADALYGGRKDDEIR
jgi:hypothetical protein